MKLLGRRPWLVTNTGQSREVLQQLATEAEQGCRRALRKEFPNAHITMTQLEDVDPGLRGFGTARLKA